MGNFKFTSSQGVDLAVVPVAVIVHARDPHCIHTTALQAGDVTGQPTAVARPLVPIGLGGHRVLHCTHSGSPGYRRGVGVTRGTHIQLGGCTGSCRVGHTQYGSQSPLLSRLCKGSLVVGVGLCGRQ